MKYFVIIICLIGLGSPRLDARSSYVIATGLKPPLVSDQNRQGFLDTLVKKAFRRLDLQLEVIILPAERVLLNANRGIEDGCLLRIKGLEKRYPNLVRVPEMLMVSEFVAYSTAVIGSDPDLKKYQPYSLAYITGWQIFDTLFDNHPYLTRVKDADQMFTLLKVGRVDAVLYERWQGLGLLRAMQIKDVRLVHPPLVSKDMYMYLHKSHRHLVEKLASELASMKRDGTYDALHESTLQSLVN